MVFSVPRCLAPHRAGVRGADPALAPHRAGVRGGDPALAPHRAGVRGGDPALGVTYSRSTQSTHVNSGIDPNSREPSLAGDYAPASTAA